MNVSPIFPSMLINTPKISKIRLQTQAEAEMMAGIKLEKLSIFRFLAFFFEVFVGF